MRRLARRRPPAPCKDFLHPRCPIPHREHTLDVRPDPHPPNPGPAFGNGDLFAFFLDPFFRSTGRPRPPCAAHQEMSGMTRSASRRTVRPPLRVEVLEDRSLLAVSVLPNDPRFFEQYGLNNTGQKGGKVDADIDAAEAWAVGTGSLTTVAAIIDSGIDYRHVDLYKNIWINQGEIPSAIRSRLTDFDGDGRISFWDLADSRNQGAGKITDLNKNGRIDGGDLLFSTTAGGWANGTSDDGDGFVDDLIGWDFANNDNNPIDDNDHGTHMAGTIGAVGNNGVGIAGVNWRVSLMALKFLNSSGFGTTDAARRALDYAVAKGAVVSNHAWG